MNSQSGGPAPILCARLLRRVDEKLIDLLGLLTPGEWELHTVAPLWKVRDVAAHLLDTALRKLSMVRDKWYVDAADIRSPQDLTSFVNELNRAGVSVYRRLSPRILIDMMKAACQQSASFHESLDPFAPAAFAVSWAGEATSLNWFDTAPGIDGALASPATDSTGHESPRHHDAETLSPGSGLFHERNAASFPRRGSAGWHSTSGRDNRRVRRMLAFVEGLVGMEPVTITVRRPRGPGNDTAGVGLASFYQGNQSRFSSRASRNPRRPRSGREGSSSDGDRRISQA